MRFLFLNLILSLVSTQSFALTSSDDVVCRGGMWGDKHVYLRTENSDGQKNLLLLFCDGPCSQPPYFFEASYKVSLFERMPSSPPLPPWAPPGGMPNERRWLTIHASGQGSDFARVSVDLYNTNLAAVLTMTPPGTRDGDPERATQITLSHCDLIPGGIRPRPVR